ncbi:MAG: GNAT family N-acetyltransferase [Gemmataceae bacterium]|nr:GNAT family N-acetyltransferase [Gemmataceae bacterium]
MPDFAIRLAALDDAEPIRAIYNHYVQTSTCTYQIELETAEERLAWMRERSDRYPATVAESGGVVIGWAALSPWKSRCGYAWAAEASVYIHPDHHRKGIGRALLLDLIARAKVAGLHTIIGGASSDQTASLALQLAVGFEVMGHFREVGRKFDRWLDVTYTQLVLGGGPA